MAKSKKIVRETREVRYPESTSRVAVGDQALTVEDAKELLGWEETDDQEKALIKDRNGKWIFCSNNVGNRPLTMSNVDSMMQEMLRKHWRVNGENLIVGKTGLLLNGQHRLIALCLAEQDRLLEFPPETGYTSDARKEYRNNWPNPITMETFIAYGIDESDETVNTMDTCKPRTLTEVICRSPYFGSMPLHDRKQASKMTEHAVRMVWHRTGAGDAFNLRKTHSESLDFISRHSKLLDCVKHIYEENGGTNAETGKKISRYISLGYAAGLMYLMASSGSDEARYYKSVHPSERTLDFTMMDKASEFWLFLADGSDEFKPLRQALGNLANELTGTGGTMAEKVAIIIKAWNLYREGESFTIKRLELPYIEVDDVRKLNDSEIRLGGIDLGPSPDREEDEDSVPTPEEIEKEKAKVKAEALKAKIAEESKPTTATKTPRKSPKQELREKQEAEALAADAAKTEPEPPTTPAPSANGVDPKTGFKARPAIKLSVPSLRGGLSS